jgi:hypothetical protein
LEGLAWHCTYAERGFRGSRDRPTFDLIIV